MKKAISFVIAMGLLLSLVGCGSSETAPSERVYSFSGENNEIRVISGRAVIGGETETFSGGTLEIKTDDFDRVTAYTMSFYISGGDEPQTILSNKVQDTTAPFQLKNQEIGQITGEILNADMDENALKENLSFKLDVTDENGNSETYIIPMEVQEVTSAKDSRKG